MILSDLDLKVSLQHLVAATFVHAVFAAMADSGAAAADKDHGGPDSEPEPPPKRQAMGYVLSPGASVESLMRTSTLEDGTFFAALAKEQVS